MIGIYPETQDLIFIAVFGSKRIRDLSKGFDSQGYLPASVHFHHVRAIFLGTWGPQYIHFILFRVLGQVRSDT